MNFKNKEGEVVEILIDYKAKVRDMENLKILNKDPEGENIVKSFPLWITLYGSYNLGWYGRPIGTMALTKQGVEVILTEEGHSEGLIYYTLFDIFNKEINKGQNYMVKGYTAFGKKVVHEADIYGYREAIDIVFENMPSMRAIEDKFIRYAEDRGFA